MSNIQNKTVVSVGMGPTQIGFIRRLKELGYTVAAFGKGVNSADAIKIADYSAEIDTRDSKSAIDWLDSLGTHIDAVGSFAGGPAIPTVQMLSNYYKTPTSIPQALITASDKLAQQQFYKEYGLSSIETWRIGNLPQDFFSGNPYDLYIKKPIVGRGSIGVSVLNKAELLKILNTSNSDDIIQTFRKGTEYRCAIIIQNGKIKLLAPIQRISYRDTSYLGVLFYNDHHLPQLADFINRFLQKTGIVNAIIKADILVSSASVDVIEMDIGVGGGNYYKTYLSCLYGCDVMDEYINLITGQPVCEFSVKHPRLRMDYIYNKSEKPITYDLTECHRLVTENYGRCKIQTNLLKPEMRGGFRSNADFILTVIYDLRQNDGENNLFAMDDFFNEQLFKERE